MQEMFYSCPALTSMDRSHISDWDTGKADILEPMFFGRKSLTELRVSG